MKAIVKKVAAPGLWLEERDVPTISPLEVLIKVKKSAICGTDIHIYNWDAWASKTVPVGCIVGHEFMGEIVELGSQVQGYKVGERVGAEGHLSCGLCRTCRTGDRHLCANTRGLGIQRDGAFAEYVAVPAENLFYMPDHIPDNIAALFDPLGNATHTALSVDLVGEDVLITGAGPIGLMACAIAKFSGARSILVTDVNDNRLDMAKSAGASHTLNVRHMSIKDYMQKKLQKRGFTVGLEMSGQPDALNALINAMFPGAHIALLGIIIPEEAPVNWNDVIFKGLTLKGIYGRKIFHSWYKTRRMIEAGLDVSSIITHELPFNTFEEGFQAMKSGQSGKVILNWNTAV